MDAKTAEMLLSLLPAQVLAAGLVRACSNFVKTDEKFAQRLLANCWTDIAPLLHEAITKQPTGKVAASVLMVESYLMNSGDWKKMERELIQYAPVSSETVEQIIKIIADGMAVVAAKKKA